jgi:hypothetical protein
MTSKNNVLTIHLIIKIRLFGCIVCVWEYNVLQINIKKVCIYYIFFAIQKYIYINNLKIIYLNIIIIHMNYKDNSNYGSSNFSGSFEDIPVCFNPPPYNSSYIIRNPTLVESTQVIDGKCGCNNEIVSISMLEICCAPFGACCANICFC